MVQLIIVDPVLNCKCVKVLTYCLCLGYSMSAQLSHKLTKGLPDRSMRHLKLLGK